MILLWMAGGRDAEIAWFFIDDLKERVAGRFQLTTDGYKPYLDAVAGSFQDGDI